MGSVVAFAPRDAATVRKPLAAGDTASIVIFPGIRYERHEAGGSRGHRSSGRRRNGTSRGQGTSLAPGCGGSFLGAGDPGEEFRRRLFPGRVRHEAAHHDDAFADRHLDEDRLLKILRHGLAHLDHLLGGEHDEVERALVGGAVVEGIDVLAGAVVDRHRPEGDRARRADVNRTFIQIEPAGGGVEERIDRLDDGRLPSPASMRTAL